MRAIGEIGVELVLGQQIEAGAVIADRHDGRVDVQLGQRRAQRLLGGRAVEHADALAARDPRRRWTGLLVARHDARAVEEGRQREVDQLAARQRDGARIAQDVDAAVAHRLEAMVGGHQHVFGRAMLRAERRAPPRGRGRRCSPPPGPARCDRNRAWRRRGSRCGTRRLSRTRSSVAAAAAWSTAPQGSKDGQQIASAASRAVDAAMRRASNGALRCRQSESIGRRRNGGSELAALP